VTVNGLQTGLRILANVVLIRSFGYNGLAMSAALGLFVQLLVLGWLVRRRLAGLLSEGWWRKELKVAAAAALAIAAAGLLVQQLSTVPALVVLLAGGAVGGTVYLLGLRLLEGRIL
jgi:peptidoglycan biosynthesis protein MviN/MurJ (putative lipid II flippase)